MCDHERAVSAVHVNEDMNMYGTASLDGTVNIYNLWSDKHMRTIEHPNNRTAINAVILTLTPLAACCFYSESDHHWYSFSINGRFLDKQPEECCHIIAAQVVKDSNFMDKLVYGTESGYVVIRELPLLAVVKRQRVSSSGYPVLSVLVSPDRRFLLVGCGDGGLNIVTDST